MSQPEPYEPYVFDHAKSIRAQIVEPEIAICREQITKYLRTTAILSRSNPARPSVDEESQIQRATSFAMLLVNQPKLADFVGQLDDCLEAVLDGAERHARSKFEDDTFAKRHTADEAILEVLNYVRDLQLWTQFTRILDLQRDKS